MFFYEAVNTETAVSGLKLRPVRYSSKMTKYLKIGKCFIIKQQSYLTPTDTPQTLGLPSRENQEKKNSRGWALAGRSREMKQASAPGTEGDLVEPRVPIPIKRTKILRYKWDASYQRKSLVRVDLVSCFRRTKPSLGHLTPKDGQ